MIGWVCNVLGVSRVAAWLIAIAALLAGIGGVYLAIEHQGEQAGAAKVKAKAATVHTAAVADARDDERAAAAGGAAIAASTTNATSAATEATRATIEDLQHAIDAVPPAAAGAALPAAPVERLRDDLNAAIARANREADSADAVP